MSSAKLRTLLEKYGFVRNRGLKAAVFFYAAFYRAMMPWQRPSQSHSFQRGACPSSIRRCRENFAENAQASSSSATAIPLIRALSTFDGLKTMTRRSAIGTSIPVLGFRPIRSLAPDQSVG
jgi:hypothetical protein